MLVVNIVYGFWDLAEFSKLMHFACVSFLFDSTHWLIKVPIHEEDLSILSKGLFLTLTTPSPPSGFAFVHTHNLYTCSPHVCIQLNITCNEQYTLKWKTSLMYGSFYLDPPNGFNSSACWCNVLFDQRLCAPEVYIMINLIYQEVPMN